MVVTLSLTEHGLIAVGLPRNVKTKLRKCATVPKVCSKQGISLKSVEQAPYSNLKNVAPGAILLPAGLLDLVVRLLDAANSHFTVSISEAHAPYQAVAPDRDARLLQRFGDQPLVDFVGQHPLGVIRHGNAFSVAAAVAQLSAAYPHANIAVLATTQEEVDRIAGRIYRLGIACCIATTGYNPPDNVRVVVGTATGLGRFSVALEHRDFLIDANVRSNLSSAGKSPVRHAWRARKYGFLRANSRLSRSDEFLLRSLFGFHDLYVPHHGACQRSVVLSWQKILGGPKISKNWWEPVALKKAAYWTNELACRLVAKFAGELSRQRVFATASPERPSRVVVLVENITQTWKLADFLPDWPILVAGGNEFDASLPPFFTKGQITTFPETNTIVTMAAIEEVNWPLVDAVVRADGGTDLIPIPPNALVASADDAVKPLLVVDLNDVRHLQLRDWARQRSRAYDRAGWFPQVADPVNSRIRVLLES